MPDKLEKTDERKWAKDVYKDFGLRAIKFTDPGRRGAPDRIVPLVGGIMLFIEQKRTNKPLRADQVDYHKWLKGLGFAVHTCHSSSEAYEKVKECYLFNRGLG